MLFIIGEEKTDSVFTRSFSALIVTVIIYFHRRESFLSESELKMLKKRLLSI
ncbi:MAG: DUF2785 domain-containing protein [Clostridium argentinense]|uniref:DUF2785 domain-containing protein n=1 Tax=Clostridium faecium TaxID=2762223 RepID=A0ABR8YVK3_9CLOT|nr:DUF2785 domain-containing protein [Clostridium faecium]MBS5823053.1 DUF2785 domain-containing protein [Clostridium argentinense]